jgi:histidyl-tRNA synthetase
MIQPKQSIAIQPSQHLELPRGFHDTDPERMAAYRRLQQGWFHACALAGYQAVDVPPVGFAETFTTGHHAAGERCYQFLDRRGRELGLISDSLPALLRLAYQRGLPEQRLSYCCPVFRYERRPRRHFHHLGAMEVAGGPATVESQTRSTRRLAEVVAGYVHAQGVATDFTITDPGLWYDLLSAFVDPACAAEYLDSLRRLPRSERPAQLTADGAPLEVSHIADLVITDRLDHLSERAPAFAARLSAAHQIAATVRSYGASATIDLGDLHASEFHDGPAFLVRQRHGPVLGDGGSYGRFARTFTGTAGVSAFAAVLGLERLADVAPPNLATGSGAAHVAVLADASPETTLHADDLVRRLRLAGISVWDVVANRAMKHHLRSIAQLSIPYSVYVGRRELTSRHYAVRDQGGDLTTVEQPELGPWLLRTLRRPVS